MNVDVPLSPLFLSPAALDRALEINLAFEKSPSAALDAIEHAKRELAEDPWWSFDRVYLSLYTLSLAGTGVETRFAIDDDRPSATPCAANLLFWLDVELRTSRNRHSLLDERAVANIINFRRAVERAIPFRIRPASLGFGCVFVEFRVDMPELPIRPVGAGLPAGSSAIFLQGHLSGARWDKIARRFNVLEVAVQEL